MVLIRRPRKKSKIVLFTSILELISNELQNQKGSITNIKIHFAGTSGHGVRSDYFQMANALGHDYYSLSFESVNDECDVFVDCRMLVPQLAEFIRS